MVRGIRISTVPLPSFKLIPFNFSPGGKLGGAKLWPTLTIIEVILESVKHIALPTFENCEDDIGVCNHEKLMLVTMVKSFPLSNPNPSYNCFID